MGTKASWPSQAYLSASWYSWLEFTRSQSSGEVSANFGLLTGNFPGQGSDPKSATRSFASNWAIIVLQITQLHYQPVTRWCSCNELLAIWPCNLSSRTPDCNSQTTNRSQIDLTDKTQGQYLPYVWDSAFLFDSFVATKLIDTEFVLYANYSSHWSVYTVHLAVSRQVRKKGSPEQFSESLAVLKLFWKLGQVPSTVVWSAGIGFVADILVNIFDLAASLPKFGATAAWQVSTQSQLWNRSEY